MDKIGTRPNATLPTAHPPHPTPPVPGRVMPTPAVVDSHRAAHRAVLDVAANLNGAVNLASPDDAGRVMAQGMLDELKDTQPAAAHAGFKALGDLHQSARSIGDAAHYMASMDDYQFASLTNKLDAEGHPELAERYIRARTSMQQAFDTHLSDTARNKAFAEGLMGFGGPAAIITMAGGLGSKLGDRSALGQRVRDNAHRMGAALKQQRQDHGQMRGAEMLSAASLLPMRIGGKLPFGMTYQGAIPAMSEAGPTMATGDALSTALGVAAEDAVTLSPEALAALGGGEVAVDVLAGTEVVGEAALLVGAAAL